jgi:hypothetical protein
VIRSDPANPLIRFCRSSDNSDHESEGFLKSLWNNITHHHNDAEQPTDKTDHKTGGDTKSDDKTNKP